MNQQRYRGFTMLEVIVIIVVLGILGVAGSNMLGGLFTFSSVSNVNDATWQGRLALEKMSREIHVIRSSSDISLASGSQITFVDINGNSIDYTSSGSTVTRNTTNLLQMAQQPHFLTLTQQKLIWVCRSRRVIFPKFAMSPLI